MNSSKLKGYLTGLILGDGYIDKGVAKRAFRIKSINKDFIEKIESDLSSSTNFKLVVRPHPARTGSDGTKHKEYLELTVKSHPYFAKIYHNFYDDFRNRIISKRALRAINWEGWANWFMSDGYIVKVGKTKGKIVDRRVELCTDRYPESGIDFLRSFMDKKYGFSIKKVRRGRVIRIRFSLYQAQYFLYQISPFVVPSMMYKLDMAYSYRPEWMTDDYYELMKTVQSVSPQNFWVKK